MGKRYEILHRDGSTLQVEGELVERDGKRVFLDGQGKPWLLLLEQDVVKPLKGARKGRRKTSKPN